MLDAAILLGAFQQDCSDGCTFYQNICSGSSIGNGFKLLTESANLLFLDKIAGYLFPIAFVTYNCS